MRIVFRVEGSPQIGLGHVMRCMALAQSLTDKQHDVFSIMSKQSQLFCQSRADWPGQIIPLDILEHRNEAEYVKQQVIDLAADWLFLDGYQFDQTYRQYLCSEHYQFAIFDDINNTGNLFADLVINGADNAQQLDYQTTAAQAELAIGSDYQVLRQEFLNLSDRQWPRRKTLTLVFGGSDTYNMTLLTLQALAKKHAAVVIPIIVITGAAYTKLNELNEFLSTSDLNITHLHDCQNMASVLANSRLAVSAAGGSQFELLACATPAILLVVADNQKLASQQVVKQGWCQVLINQQTTAEQLVNHCLALWQQPKLLESMHQKALQQPVKDGAQAIVCLMTRLSHLEKNR
ncbi:UDP-2,4-diacetamido-2,4,6-trideoxy-beta-L-altropyranose hydrolase [Paraglaciecola sp. L3A3]|uniref:UDP-2,4-diacetamido-2,4, 6-trideoxy-beta-L-altropyranose hydrolase n=1 Tax=Paraglaciecola sp. L3A3 TaxID=2686358 RepID=UPI00131DD295|nr:UDP-2,4-diacetamido-2,4,6-trideoxy-beta-L-altropyranose hydrolase [Paraglaciecola sp. L3A3]